MRLGKVIGKLVLSTQEPAYAGGRWLIVSPLGKDQYQNPRIRRISEIYSVVVYDNLGAREGDIVGFVEGTEATAPFEHPMPIDAINAAIIDSFQYSPLT